MNKVLNVDEKSASCLLEPGVTYVELYEELKVCRRLFPPVFPPVLSFSFSLLSTPPSL
jgi:FAD/FMN-containing dehydrogenase